MSLPYAVRLMISWHPECVYVTAVLNVCLEANRLKRKRLCQSVSLRGYLRQKMSNFRQEYKSKTFGFGNVAVNRLRRVEKKEISRKKQRAALFNENRNILNNSLKKEEDEPQEIDRTNRLLKWKEEREKRKKLEQAKKKPAFVVGKMHHKIYSPIGEISAPLKQTAIKQSSKKETINVKQKPLPKGITKATEKRLQRKANEKKVDSKVAAKKLNPANKVKDTKENEQPSTSAGLRAEKIKINDGSIMFGKVKIDDEEEEEDTFTLKISLDEDEKVSDGHNSTYDISEDNQEVHNKSIPEAKDINTSTSAHNKSTPINQRDPAFYSPYIVSSRGKDNARKEQQLRRGFSLVPSPKDSIPTKDTVMKNLNISVEEEERTAQYFLYLLNQEIDRLNDLCEKWMKVKDEDETTEDGQYWINQAIGQTNLLISKKFERFRGLVTDCESGRGEMLVTCRDLQGFWDSMYVEVKNCDSRFQKLEELRSHGWKETETPLKKPIVKKKTNAKKKVAPSKPSSFRTFLQNKKKKMTEGTSNNDDAKEDDSNSNNIAGNESEGTKPITVIDNSKRKTLSIGAKKTTPLGSRRKSSLLQNSQLSDVSKSVTSPLTIMKISQMCKTPVVLLDDSISYINSKQTPAKSILKQSKNVVIDFRTKSSNKVNFDDQIVSNEVPIDEETRIKMDLSAALSRIDELDFDRPAVRVEKKLDFDDCEEDNNDKQESVSNNYGSLPVPTSETEELNKSQTKPRRKSLRRQNAIVMDVDNESLREILPANVCNSTPFNYTPNNVDLNSTENKDKELEFADNVRVLRNRVVTPTRTPKARRSKRATINVLELEHKENETPVTTHLEEGVRLRRSARIVKFSEKEQSDEADKPTLPVTPHIRRSRKRSSTWEKSTIEEHDTISSKMLEKPPERIRRSQAKKL